MKDENNQPSSMSSMADTEANGEPSEIESHEQASLLSRDQYEGGQAGQADAAEGVRADLGEQKTPPPIDYQYMDGLRGMGAFAVYLSHFRDQFYPYPSAADIAQGEDSRHLPDAFRNSPLQIIHHGYFWVLVFFLLSGFVLPLRFFRTGNTTCITAGTFRRYLRLMLPLLVILSLYYFFMKMDAMGPYTFKRIKGKTFMHVLVDGLFGTWLCDDSWSTATWTLSIELVATFLVYLLAQTAVQYRVRYWLYFAACFFIWIPQVTDKVGLTKLDFGKLIIHLPVFFLGAILADFETMKDHRPLDALRNLNTWWKIPINLALVWVFLSLGSYKGNGKCLTDDDGDCEFWRYATLNFTLNKLICNYLAAIALFLLALTSSWFQWFLGSAVLQFMGRISYSLYLVHELVTEWAEVDTYYSFLGHEVDPNLAVLYVFLIYTPVLILGAWVLTVLVDAPSKDFAYQLDLQTRKERPPAPMAIKDGMEEPQEDEEYYSCGSFTKRSWAILAYVGWLVTVLIVTELYSAFKPDREVRLDDVSPALTVTSQRHEKF